VFDDYIGEGSKFDMGFASRWQRSFDTGERSQFYFGLRVVMFLWTVKEKKSGFEDQEQDDVNGA
jgi:hypothetical protein